MTRATPNGEVDPNYLFMHHEQVFANRLSWLFCHHYCSCMETTSFGAEVASVASRIATC